MPLRQFFAFIFLCFFSLSLTAAEGKAPLYIGIDADFSAVAIEGGFAIKHGAEIAADEINQSGGILGRELKIVTLDHRGNPARGIYNLQQFNQNPDLLAVMGGVHTPVAIAELPFIHEQNLLFLIPWAAGTPLIDNGYTPNNVFRVSVRDEQAGQVLISHAKKLNATRIALVLERTGWGRSNEASLIQAAEAQNINIVATHWVNWQQKSFTDEARKIKAADVDAVILVTNAPEGAVVVNALHQSELSALPVISHWGIASGNFAERLNVPASQLNLAILQTFHFNYQNNVKSQRLLNAYFKQHGLLAPEAIPASVGMAHAYDLIHLLARAAENAGAVDTDKLRTALENIDNYNGAVKRYAPAFSKNQHDALMAKDYFMTTMNDKGHLVLLEQQ